MQILLSQNDSIPEVPSELKTVFSKFPVLKDIANRASLTNYYMKKAKIKDIRLASKDSIIDNYKEREELADVAISQLILLAEDLNKTAEFGNRLATVGLGVAATYTYGHLADNKWKEPLYVFGTGGLIYIITEWTGGINFFTVDLNPLRIFR